MMMRSCLPVISLLGATLTAAISSAQPLGEPDRGQPGDAMIQAYLAAETDKLAAKFAEDIVSREAWEAKRPEYVEQYYYMLGLSPRPEKTDLAATITGTLKGDGYEVDMLHYQSRPKLYVTANLYRPAGAKEERLPAVLYVCGHSGRGRNGNKVAFQSHGIWLARHGYVCLMVDTLQLGEIAAFHHGTYNLNRWWWHSRGYTPAGVEAWNGIRGIDYLISRADVDPQRIAVTGISGGGAATFWVAAADERVKVAIPVSGMADLESYVPNRVINGHCDCMFLYNTFQWPWTRIAGLVAPRPMLFVNSDNDRIFPMDANERITNRLERLYSLFGNSGEFDTIVSVGGHAYRQDIRQAAFRFLNMHLKGDARPIADSEIDVVSEGSNSGPYPIAPERLRDRRRSAGRSAQYEDRRAFRVDGQGCSAGGWAIRRLATEGPLGAAARQFQPFSRSRPRSKTPFHGEREQLPAPVVGGAGRVSRARSRAAGRGRSAWCLAGGSERGRSGNDAGVGQGHWSELPCGQAVRAARHRRDAMDAQERAELRRAVACPSGPHRRCRPGVGRHRGRPLSGRG
ncbi:MAG: prolyl oligopeptidase family serine peptidase [Planctomycetaceae bacterium]|nr:prolyl oligopeptidase family serine peptidase [Planctomycetaceae bacterium]